MPVVHSPQSNMADIQTNIAQNENANSSTQNDKVQVADSSQMPTQEDSTNTQTVEESGDALADTKNEERNGNEYIPTQREGKCKLCTSRNDRWMVRCDKCDLWYHYRCVGVDNTVRFKKFTCDECTSKRSSSKQCRSKASARSSNHTIKVQLARLEEERLYELRLIEEERRREIEYSTKRRELEKKKRDERYDLLEQLCSETNSSCDKRSLTSSWVASKGKSLLPNHLNQTEVYDQVVQNKEDNKVARKYVLTEDDLMFFDRPTISNEVNIVMEPPTSSELNEQFCEKSTMPGPSGRSDTKLQISTQSKLPTSGNHQLITTDDIKPLPTWDAPPQRKPEPLHRIHSPPEVEQVLTPTQIQARTVFRKKDLPEFSGNPSDWPIFYTNYIRTTSKCAYSNDENLERLLKALKGDARKLVKSRLIDPNTVPSVIESLRRRYGNPTKLLNELIQNVRKVPKVKSDSAENLLDLSAAVEDLVATIISSDIPEELRNRMLLDELALKLPFSLRMSWTSHSKDDRTADLATFNDWLVNIADTAGLMPEEKRPVEKPEQKGDKSKKRAPLQVRAHDVQPKTNTPKSSGVQSTPNCPACSNDQHTITSCSLFSNLDKDARWGLFIAKKLCRICLAKHHTKECTQTKKCGVDSCEKLHHPMLHNPRVNTKGTPPPSEETNPVVENHNHQLNSHDALQSILYRIVPVKLFNHDREIETFAFMDDGSSTTMLEKEIADKLGLDGPVGDLCIKWTADVSRTEKDSRKVSLEISSTNANKRRFKLMNIQTVESLNLPSQSVEGDLLTYQHLRNLPIAKYKRGKPTILIGMDQYRLCVPLKIREGPKDTPTATKTRLGWVIAGSTSSGSEVRLNFHTCGCNREDEIGLHNLVKEFITSESLVTTPGVQTIESSDVIRAKQVLESTTKLHDNKYETGLLWKTPEVVLPESRKMAERRLSCLEKKLARDDELLQNVRRQMSEYIEKGYARQLTDSEAAKTTDRTWYLPVFTVRNPNKPAKVRLVWDAAAKSHGASLNDALLKGPDLLNPLQEVLMRFRERPIAVGGDLKEMFHQVRVIDEDQDSQRFLWRDDPSQKAQTYIMQVMTFGASCSPASAQYVLHTNSNRFAEELPRAVLAIQRNHYVDDWLDSFGSVEEALRVIDDVKQIHNAGGFSIHNWVSNSTDVLAHLNETGELQKSLTNSDVSVERILGMHWRTNDDKFVFVINRSRINPDILEGRRNPTKREVLSTVMSIFDPLGLIASYVVYAKVLLQDIWRSGIGWDDEILYGELQKWTTWTAQFDDIEKVAVPRCYTGLWSENETTYELHVFCDASEAAYAAVAYICSIKHNVRECALIASKTRVAPTKPTSIPRLELLGAVLGTRLMKTIQRSHSIKFQKRFFWTDSRTVLSWLNSDARKYRQFVALRIAEILEATDEAEWMWVPTQQNVADEGTKWVPSTNFSSDSRWYHGPNFLKKPPEEWPKPEKQQPDLTTEDIRPSFFHTIEPAPVPITPNAENFSTWERLCRITSILPDLARLWLGKIRQSNTATEEPSNKWKRAEIALFKEAQLRVYGDEIQQLSMAKSIDKSSKIYQLSPYLDDEGLLRMRGRIDNAPGIQQDMKRPIILPHEGRISFLYADYFHREFLHRNHDTALNEIRQRVVIPRLRVLMKKVRKSCQRCKNNMTKPSPPEMGPLPTSRLQIHRKPFSSVGLDYFGPIEVCVGRRIEKRYGALFTCMTTRAIHIEVTHALTTDSCILALARFMDRRGTVDQITSDNATNFRGASKELMIAIQGVSTEKITQTFPKINWSFIPPSSPHFGGTWERLVRTVKSNLYELLHEKRPSDEILATYLARVENIINSRPLTDVPIEDESSEAITPNHLIHGTTVAVVPFFDEGLDAGRFKKQWITVEQMATTFWRRFIREYLPTLTKRTKWFQKAKPLNIGDIVIVVDERSPRNTWPKGVIVDVIRGKDGQTRSAVVRTQTGTYTKPTVKLAVLDVKKQPPVEEPRSQLTEGDNVGDTALTFCQLGTEALNVSKN